MSEWVWCDTNWQTIERDRNGNPVEGPRVNGPKWSRGDAGGLVTTDLGSGGAYAWEMKFENNFNVYLGARGCYYCYFHNTEYVAGWTFGMQAYVRP